MGSKHRGGKVEEPAETSTDGGFVSNAAHAVAGAGSGLREAVSAGAHDVADRAHDAGERARAAAEDAGERARAAAESGAHAAGGAKDAVAGKALVLRSSRRKLVAGAAAVAVAGFALLAGLFARRSRD
jgi:hypothetical protein